VEPVDKPEVNGSFVYGDSAIPEKLEEEIYPLCKKLTQQKIRSPF
jgi:hypothetical protein